MNGRFTMLTRFAAVASFAVVAACSGPQPAGLSVSQALAAPDDTEAVITARIVQDLGDGRYLMSDGTGQITVDIDQDLRGQLQFAPDTQLRVFGELDRDSDGSVLEAKTVQVVQ